MRSCLDRGLVGRTGAAGGSGRASGGRPLSSDFRMDALAVIDTWGAAHAAAVVIDDSGVVGGHGDLDHPFPLASVTKLLTAYAALIAVEEGSIGLDEPAGQPGATVRHLLAHAAGYAFDGAEPIARPGTPPHLLQHRDRGARHPPRSCDGHPDRRVHRARPSLVPSALRRHDAWRARRPTAARVGGRSRPVRGRAAGPHAGGAGHAGRGHHRAVPGAGRDPAGHGPLRPPRLGPRLRAPRRQDAPLDRHGQLAGHLRPLRRGGHVPVGRPGGPAGRASCSPTAPSGRGRPRRGRRSPTPPSPCPLPEPRCADHIVVWSRHRRRLATRANVC